MYLHPCIKTLLNGVRNHALTYLEFLAHNTLRYLYIDNIQQWWYNIYQAKLGYAEFCLDYSLL